MRLFHRRRDLVCRQAVELMTDYLEDDLGADERQRLEAHLAGCPHCTEYLAQLRATITATGRRATPELDPDTRRALIDLYRRTAG